jgi:hypothetical protein
MPSPDRSTDMLPVRPFIRSPWGDRRDLIPKRMTYVCTLDVAFYLSGRYLTVPRSVRADGQDGETFHVLNDAALDQKADRSYGVVDESSSGMAKSIVEARPVDADVGRTYHVFGDTSFQTASGLVQEVPLLQVVAGEAELRPDLGDEALTFVGRLTLAAQPKAYVLLDFEGVVTPVGGVRSLDSHKGAVPAGTFISTRHQCDVPSLRWLTRCQLFGVGQTRFEAPHGKMVNEPRKNGGKDTPVGDDGYRYIRVSLDLLSAA